MGLGLTGLPLIAELDTARNEFFKHSHNWDQDPNDPSVIEKSVCWFVHKGLTTISFPANVVEVGVCTVGFIASACTLGALKVAIFSFTLGNVKPGFSTGCVWFGERALHGVMDIALNTGELLYDAGNIVYQGYRAARWVAGQLHLGNLFNAIIDQIGRLFEFIGERIGQGIDKAAEVEGTPQFGAPYPLNLLDDLTKKYRIDFGSQDRSLEDIFKHYVLSVLNIPLNAATAIGAAGLSIILGSAFVAKVILYSTTNINIPIPTFAGEALSASVSTAYNVIADASNDAADIFVLIYKTSAALGLNHVVATAVRVVLYIPEALFS